jgi:hypothetical protein
MKSGLKKFFRGHLRSGFEGAEIDTDLRSGLRELSGLGMEAEDPRPLIP